MEYLTSQWIASVVGSAAPPASIIERHVVVFGPLLLMVLCLVAMLRAERRWIRIGAGLVAIGLAWFAVTFVQPRAQPLLVWSWVPYVPVVTTVLVRVTQMVPSAKRPIKSESRVLSRGGLLYIASALEHENTKEGDEVSFDPFFQAFQIVD